MDPGHLLGTGGRGRVGGGPGQGGKLVAGIVLFKRELCKDSGDEDAEDSMTGDVLHQSWKGR